MPQPGLSGASLAPARRLSGSTFVTQLNRIASSAVDACRRRGQLPGPAALPPAFTYRFLQSRYLTALSRIPSPRSPWLRCAGAPSRPQRRGRRGGEQSKKRRSMPDGRHRAQTATETFPPDLVFLAVPRSQTLLAWEIKWRHFGRRSSLQQAALTLHHGRTRFSEKNTRQVFIGALVQIDKIDHLGSFEIHVDGGGQKADRILACQQSSTESDAALTRDRGKNPHTRARTRKHRTRTCP